MVQRARTLFKCLSYKEIISDVDGDMETQTAEMDLI